MKFQRSLPYFNRILKASSVKRISLLHTFPTFVVDDLIEILYNVVIGNIDIGTRKQNLKKHRKALLDVVHANNKKVRRGIILKQTGGFLGTLLPIVLSALGGVIASNL